MSKKEKQNETLQQEPVVEEQDVKQEAAAEPEETAVDPLLSELESLKDQVAGQEDKYLRWRRSMTTTASVPPKRRNPCGPT